jgi:hypothetical protein
MAAHWNTRRKWPRATKFYDRTRERLTQDEVEQVLDGAVPENTPFMIQAVGPETPIKEHQHPQDLEKGWVGYPSDQAPRHTSRAFELVLPPHKRAASPHRYRSLENVEMYPCVIRSKRPHRTPGLWNSVSLIVEVPGLDLQIDPDLQSSDL